MVKPSYTSNPEEKKPKHLCLLIRTPVLRDSDVCRSTSIDYCLCVKKIKIGNRELRLIRVKFQQFLRSETKAERKKMYSYNSKYNTDKAQMGN